MQIPQFIQYNLQLPVIKTTSDLIKEVHTKALEVEELLKRTDCILHSFCENERRKLIGATTTQEAVWSSKIEGIEVNDPQDLNAFMSVDRCRSALVYAQQDLEMQGEPKIIRESVLLAMHQLLEQNNAGYRKLPGTKILSNKGEVVHEPPQNTEIIPKLMSSLFEYIHEDDETTHPLVKIAVTHMLFETIHPFYDGNGRLGRHLITLQLMLYGMISEPCFLISREIYEQRERYYNHFRAVRDAGEWHGYILWFLHILEKSARNRPF